MSVVRRLRPSDELAEAIRAKLEKAVQDYNLEDDPDYQKLNDLSHSTQLDGIQVDPDVIISRGSIYSAPATVDVILEYTDGRMDVDVVRSFMSFPATVEFEFVDGDVSIKKIEIDVSSFYE